MISYLYSLGPLKYEKEDGKNYKYKYEFEFKANTDNEYIITPISDILLFNPSSSIVIGENDCRNDVAVFSGDMGKVMMNLKDEKKNKILYTILRFLNV